MAVGSQGAKAEILGAGQQFVAFGIHPDTGQPYDWPLGETPLDVAFADLPATDATACAALLAEISALLPEPTQRSRSHGRQTGAAGTGPERDVEGRVVDGRDGWLSSIAFHAVHDALAQGWPLDRDALAERVWRRFVDTTDLSRPRKDGAGPWDFDDAAQEVADKLRLQAEGRLPPRDPEPGETSGQAPDYTAPTLSAAAARDRLDATLDAACDRIAAWHADPTEPCPQIGIRATVGLGKSARSRKPLLGLRDRLIAAGAPAGVLILVPPHDLAEEAAAAWRGEGVRVAVHRGYEAMHPRLRKPMCRDPEAVRAAVAARLPVHEAACATRMRRCRSFDGCLKQQNRTETAGADIVIAAQDVLFSGFAIAASNLGVIIIDEGCWQRALRQSDDLRLETFATELLGRSLRGRASEDAISDLHDLRCRAVEAMRELGPVSPHTAAGRRSR